MSQKEWHQLENYTFYLQTVPVDLNRPTQLLFATYNEGGIHQGMTYCGFFSICRLRLICLQNNRQSADCRSRYRSYLHKPPRGHARRF